MSREPAPDTASTSRRPRAAITGASAGIGAAFARRLARDGYDLTIIARRSERLRVLADELSHAYGCGVEVAVADLADAGQVKSLARSLSADDRVRLLVNCAGFAGYKAFIAQDPGEVQSLIDVHVSATTRLTRAVLPTLVTRGAGAVINVASLLAFSESLPVDPLPLRAVYTGAKAYLVAFTQAVNAELAGSGVSAQVCCPGVVATEFHAVEGIDLSHSPFKPMSAEAVVAASMAALALGEPLCLPGLDDVDLVERYHEQQRLLVQLANRDHLASRYETTS